MSSKHEYNVAVIPGDGIGQEVIPAAVQVVDAAVARDAVVINWNWLDWGCDRYVSHGSMMPSDGLETLGRHDSILLGAVGRPDVPDTVSLWGLLIPIRRTFDQYVNLRPVRTFEGIEPTVRVSGAERIDLMIVRENTEGEYSEVGGRFGKGTSRDLAIQNNIFTRVGVERVTRFAFNLAERRRGLVTSATKSNGIIHTMPFWDEVVQAVALDYPKVTCSSRLIDALAADLVLAPARFDVIVASNLFGDILSDLAGAVVGSLGLAPSANLDPEGRYPSMFEPVHGSAPDISGTNCANPVAAVWSGAMMLEDLGLSAAAGRVMRAIEESLKLPEARTVDVSGSASTSQVANWMTKFIDSLED